MDKLDDWILEKIADRDDLKPSESAIKVIGEVMSESKDKPDVENSIRMAILQSSLDNANDVYKQIIAEEKTKNIWRKFFILFFSILLAIALAFIGILTTLDSLGIVALSTELVVGIFAYIFADIFSIIYFMLKYINDPQYLKSFEATTHKLLDYLIQDKATGGSSKKIT